MNEHPNIAHEDESRVALCMDVLADLRYVVDERGDTARVFRTRFAIKDFIEQVMQGNIPHMMWLWAAPTTHSPTAAVDPACDQREPPHGDVTAQPPSGRIYRIVHRQEWSDDGGNTWQTDGDCLPNPEVSGPPSGGSGCTALLGADVLPEGKP